MSNYEGWSNSATYLAAQYLLRSSSVYEKIKSILGRCVLLADTMSVVVAAVKVRKQDFEDGLICGVVGNILYLDSWAEGSVNWQEIVDVYATELGIEPINS